MSDQERRLLKEGDAPFRKRIQAIANDSHCIILCGTYHDVKELTNKAVLFVPGLNRQVEHRKLTSADAVGEVVRGGGTSDYLIYDTVLGRIGILICKDAYDLNVFCRYALSASPRSIEKVPDLILVPALSRGSLADACKELSYFAKTIVAYADGWSSPKSALYVAGVEIGSEAYDRESLFELSWEERHRHIDKATSDQEHGIFASVYGSRTGKGTD